MKNKLFCLLLASVLSYSCDDSEESKAISKVVISSPTDVTATTATVSGSISSNGNSKVTETGFVYSSNVMQPTTEDSKAKSTITTGSFTVKLEGLASGTTYHLRAYAINDIGTGYSDVIDFTTGNMAPTASGLSIDGLLEVGKTITAKYNYSDAEDDKEGESSFQWYVADDVSGNNETMIDGAASKTFLIQDAQNGKFLRFSIFPKATAGTSSGGEIKSGYSTAVGAETVSFIYDGSNVTYGTIVSSLTQRKWLDRNLGADRVALTVDDYLAYGHYFQWGRSADGHQIVVRSGAANGDIESASSTTSTKSNDVVAPDNKFVIDSDFGTTADWLSTQNSNLWQGVIGVNNPCPAGWRLPTRDEWIAENLVSLADGFDKLKLTYTGYRAVEDASFYSSTTLGSYWTSTTGTEEGIGLSFRVRFNASFFSGMTNRGNAFACRCIKN